MVDVIISKIPYILIMDDRTPHVDIRLPDNPSVKITLKIPIARGEDFKYHSLHPNMLLIFIPPKQKC
jgi:hypothetical protein